MRTFMGMAVYPTEQEVLPEQILQAALQLYLKHGLKKVTMDDVSRVIGKSRSSLYYYYKNREEIFEAVMDMLIRDVIAEIEREVNKADTIEGKIRSFCLVKIKTSEERRTVFVAMEAGMDAEEKSRHQQSMNDAHQRIMKAETSLLHKNLSAATRNKEIRNIKPKELDNLIFVLLSSIRGIRRELAAGNQRNRMENAVETLTEMAMKWLTK
jgi:AcrR family transcriptional regulator